MPTPESPPQAVLDTASDSGGSVSLAAYREAVQLYSSLAWLPINRTGNASIPGGFSARSQAARAMISWTPPSSTMEFLLRHCGSRAKTWRWGPELDGDQPEGSSWAVPGGPTHVPFGMPRVKSLPVIVISYWKGTRCQSIELSQRYDVVLLAMSTQMHTYANKQGVTDPTAWIGALPPTFREIALVNFGKGEEMNYLRFFRDNYDDLPPWIAVMQGEATSHMPRPLRPDLLDGSRQRLEAVSNRDTWITDYPPPLTLEQALDRLPIQSSSASFETLGGGRYRNFVCERMDGGLSRWRMANIHNVRRIYEALGLPIPPQNHNICHFAVCCQCFAVRAEAVKAWPREVYEKLLALRRSSLIHWNDIEFSWHFIFGGRPLSDGLVETSWVPDAAWPAIKEQIRLSDQTCEYSDLNHTIKCGPWKYSAVHPVVAAGYEFMPNASIF